LNRFLRGIGLYLIIALIAVSIVTTVYQPRQKYNELTYSQFYELLNDDKIVHVKLIGDTVVQGRLKDGTFFVANIPPGTTDLGDRLVTKGVEVTAEPAPTAPWWTILLPNVITIVVFIGIWLFILNQMQGGNNRAMSFGKSRAKLHTEEKSKVRFDDVAGVDEAKQELAEIVEFLKQPKKFIELGAKIPKGVLLMGPPGTGKTLLGRAVAGEAGVPFFSISGSDFVEMFVGVGASRVRDLFDTAKKNSPCIIFVDELDAVGRQRGAGLGGGHDEREQTLNQLLVEMDGFEASTGIIVMAATNRPDVLDPALLRPGRFDRKIVVDIPDAQGREEILKIHARNKPLDKDVDMSVIAKQTPGFAGADLENLLNEAAILAARRNRKSISMFEVEEAIDRIVMGPERKNKRITERDKEVIAHHEAGHAVAAYYTPDSDPVHKITIVGRGRAGGYTMILPEEEHTVHTRAEMKNVLVRMLGGRAAEEIAFNKDEITSGAHNDLERVTKLARKMVMEYGMSERLGPITYGNQQEEQIFLGRDISRHRNYSEEVAAAIDAEVRQIVDEAYERTLSILREHYDKLLAVVEALKEKETLTRAEFEAIMAADDVNAAAAEPTPNSGAVESDVESKPAPAPVEKKEKPRVLSKPNPAVNLE
jgi:cell division protease FtsH